MGSSAWDPPAKRQTTHARSTYGTPPTTAVHTQPPTHHHSSAPTTAPRPRSLESLQTHRPLHEASWASTEYKVGVLGSPAWARPRGTPPRNAKQRTRAPHTIIITARHPPRPRTHNPPPTTTLAPPRPLRGRAPSSLCRPPGPPSPPTMDPPRPTHRVNVGNYPPLYYYIRNSVG